MRIKKILVSQPKPTTEKSPYFELADKYNLKIDFRQFIEIEGISVKEFRQSRININDFTALIFTSRTAIDNFFRICEEMKIIMPDATKYFCISESIAFYLQKYIVYRKRKIFFGKATFSELMDIIQKHNEDNFLLPLSDIHKQEIPNVLTRNNIKFTKAVLYRTISANLSDLVDVNYDALVFFSPSGIASLIHNFPDFKQNETKIASFGPSTAKAVEKAGLRLDIQAPMPKAPSMTMALDNYIKQHIKDCKKC